MIKVVYLFWSFLIGLFVTFLSYFYKKEEGGGYPFSYFRTTEKSDTLSNLLVGQSEGRFNYLTFIVDLVFWWLILSLILVVVKNYLLDFDAKKQEVNNA